MKKPNNNYINFTVKIAFVFLLFTGVSNITLGQIKTVSGKVIDPNGIPASLVTVEVLNKHNTVIAGTTSDMNGEFNLKIDKSKNQIIRFSYLGYENQIAEIDNKEFLKVQMLKSAKSIDDNNSRAYSKIGLNE